jgi:hypothetical protein
MAVLGIDGMPYQLTVEISFASVTSPPVWVDVTAYTEAFTTSRGREDVFDVAQPGQLTLRLDNSDGRFDPLNSAGPYFGSIRTNNQVRIRAEATSGSGVVGLFYGYVDRWERSWPGGAQHSVTTVTATDLFKIMANRDAAGARGVESTGARIDGLLGGDAVIYGTDGFSVTAYTYLNDEMQLDIVQDLALGAGGLFFIAGDGTIAFQTPYYRGETTRANTAQCSYVFGTSTLGTTAGNNDVEIDTDVAPALDDTLVANTITVTNSSTGFSVTDTDATAAARDSEIEYQLDTLLSNAAATTRADVLKRQRKDIGTVPRVDSVTLDALTSTDCLTEALRRELSDRIRLKIGGLGDGASWQQDCYIEAISHTVSLGDSPAWDTTMTLSPVVYQPTPP